MTSDSWLRVVLRSVSLFMEPNYFLHFVSHNGTPLLTLEPTVIRAAGFDVE